MRKNILKDVEKIYFVTISNWEIEYSFYIFSLNDKTSLFLDSKIEFIKYEDILHLLTWKSKEEYNSNLDELIKEQYIGITFSFIDLEIKKFFWIKFIYWILNSLDYWKNINVLLAENWDFVKIDWEFVYDIEPINNLGVVWLNQEGSSLKTKKFYRINWKRVIEEYKLKEILKNYRLER